jgi:elongation factor G
VREEMRKGINAGFQVVDVRVTILEASCPDIGAGEISFQMAASRAFRDGCTKAGSKLLEPVMNMAVVTPDQFMGAITGDLHRRRGELRGMDESAGGKIIRAEVPLAEVFGYSTRLRSMSQGRATYSMEFSRYANVPPRVAAPVMSKD